jgi:hypothetical protein
VHIMIDNNVNGLSAQKDTPVGRLAVDLREDGRDNSDVSQTEAAADWTESPQE